MGLNHLLGVPEVINEGFGYLGMLYRSDKNKKRLRSNGALLGGLWGCLGLKNEMAKLGWFWEAESSKQVAFCLGVCTHITVGKNIQKQCS